MKRFPALIAIAVLLAGCTSNATRKAIESYELAETRQQQAFDNAYRAAEEQLFLATAQFVHQNKDDEQAIQDGLKAAWKARGAIEEARVQYLMARAMSLTTVGIYLYDQQGWFNVLFEDLAKDGKRHADALQKAHDAAGADLPDVIQDIRK